GAGELEEVALGGDVGAGEPGRGHGGGERDRGEQRARDHIFSSSSAPSGVTQMTAALLSSSARLITVVEPPGGSSESVSGAARWASGRTSIAWAARSVVPGRRTRARAATAPALRAAVMTWLR